MSETQIPARYCILCGGETPKSTGPGRPRTYCSKECADLESDLRRLESSMQRFAEAKNKPMGDRHARELRSRLWYLANFLNTRPHG